MKYWLFLLIILCSLKKIYAIWQPKPGTTWNYILTGSIYLHFENSDILDIDLFDKSEEDIQYYHEGGKKVICYFSGGIFDERSDKDEFYKVDGLVNKDLKKTVGNYWLDIRKEELKPILKARMELAVSKKCDGIDVDYLDGYENEKLQKAWSDNPLTKEDAVAFAKWLAATAHELDLAIGLRNSLFMIDEVGDDFDFAVNENCNISRKKPSKCYLYKDFLQKDKAVFVVFFQKSVNGNTEICEAIEGYNFSVILKERQWYITQSNSIYNQSYCSVFKVLETIGMIIFLIILGIFIICILFVIYRSFKKGKRKNKVEGRVNEEGLDEECLEE